MTSTHNAPKTARTTSAAIGSHLAAWPGPSMPAEDMLVMLRLNQRSESVEPKVAWPRATTACPSVAGANLTRLEPVMQPTSDIFLGYASDIEGRDTYVRQRAT